MTKGIKGLQKQELRKVAEDIKTYDGGSTIDGLICKTGTNGWSTSLDDSSGGGDKHTNVVDGTKCPTKSGVTPVGLAKFVSKENGPGSTGLFSDDTKMDKLQNTSAKISKDITGTLNREQHGVVSSAFAKAHEGAEIVEIRSISTTSVMVNACYDVLAEGLPVSPYGCAVYT